MSSISFGRFFNSFEHSNAKPAISGEAVYKARYMLKYFQTDYFNNDESRLVNTTQQNNAIQITAAIFIFILILQKMNLQFQ